MAYSYNQLIAELTAKYGLADNHRAGINLEITQAWLDWQVPDDHAAIQDIIQGLEETRDAFVDMLSKGYYGYNGSTYCLPTALDLNKACTFISEATVTMADILNAMLTANADEVMYFVGLVDAYRQSVWNRDFNQEFFGALAQGFMP